MFQLEDDAPIGEVTAPLDKAMLDSWLNWLPTTRDFESYEQARALERAEKFFWSFCDNYLELVKNRRYGNEGEEAEGSANRALTTALSAQLRLLAPHLPFVTEEVWSMVAAGSIHRAAWPRPEELSKLADGVGSLPLEVASAVLAEVRKAKTEAKVSLRTEVANVTVRDTAARLDAFRLVRGDVKSAGGQDPFHRVGRGRDVRRERRAAG